MTPVAAGRLAGQIRVEVCINGTGYVRPFELSSPPRDIVELEAAIDNDERIVEVGR